MNTASKRGGHSPRSMNSPTTSQVKAGTDGKGRKRERADQSSESVKRERIDDSGSGFRRTESSLKYEIAKITKKGRLVDSEGVERLVQLMLPERKKIDLIGRSILAGVVAATDKLECLSLFVQLRGLHVFDEFLQEIHKGKIGDASSPKENDRSVDDFVLILLRALDRLPVNLNALQTCNIGKSVNHLRSHKNPEIRKKARSLVDTWKKRVEVEMDATSGSNQGASWPGRPRQSEVSHGGRHSGVSMDATKTSALPSENSMKSATSSPSSTRSAPSRGTGALHREVRLSRSVSSQRTATSEKVSLSTLTHEKILDAPMADGCSNKLITKLPKRVRSSEQSVSGGSSEDPAAGNSRAPSPVPSENHDRFDRNVKEINDTYQGNVSPDSNTESSQHNDLKYVPTFSDEVAGSPSVNVADEHSKVVNDSSQVAGIVKPTSPILGDSVKTKNRNCGSHCSMNALIESCIRESETNACTAGADDVGMNLLAAVAADEISKSPGASPSISRVSDSLINDNSITENHTIQINNSLDCLPSELAEAVAKDPTNADSEQHVSGSDERLVVLENVNDFKQVDLDENSDSEIEELQRLVDQCLEGNENSDDVVAQTAVPTTVAGENMSDDCDSGVVGSDLKTDVTSEIDRVADTTKTTRNSDLSECKATGITLSADSLASEHLHLDDTGDSKISELVNKMGEGVSEFAKDMSTGNVDRSLSEKKSDGNDCGVVNDRKADVTSVADRVSDTAERAETSVPAECKAMDLIPKVHSLAVPSSLSDVVGENKKEQKSQVVLKSSATNGEGEHVEASLTGIEEECRRANGSRVSGADVEEAEECSSVARDVSSVIASAGSEMEARVEFDLNEGFNGDDTRNGNSNNFSGSLSSTPTPLQPSRLPASVTAAAAAAKGAFVPREDLLRNKATVGWRGSAATSSFQSAEPRKFQEVMPLSINNVSSTYASATTGGKQTKTFLDFDLNVHDERVLEDLAYQRSANPKISSGSLDLDLNKVDEPTDMKNYTTSSAYQVNSSYGGRRDFDLNDGPEVDDPNVESSMVFSQHSRSGLTSQPMISSGVRMNGITLNRLPASITVAAAAKGAFVPRDDLLRNKATVGWRGYAATSAFRPAEPRKVQEVMPLSINNLSSTDASATTSCKQTKTFLDFDLNVPDERVHENLAYQRSSNPENSSGYMDLDLNKVDDPAYMNYQVNLSSGGRRDFELNNGPNVDASMVFCQQYQSGLTSQPVISSGLRMNGENMAGCFSSWFPSAYNYAAMSNIPQVLPERGIDQRFNVSRSNGPERMMGPTSRVSSFTHDMYRGPVLMSSPAVSFPHSTFPYGSSFPVSSTSYSGGSNPYMMDSSSSDKLSFPNGSSNGGVLENNGAK